MATAPAAPATTTVIVRRRRTHVELARWSTIILAIFMMLLPLLSRVDPSGMFTHFLNEWLFVVFIGYMSIQFWETASRSSTDQAGFLEDNALALGAFVIGFGIFVLFFSRVINLTPDQFHILLQCWGWDGLDFIFGVMISNRIASSAKERDEIK